MAASESRGLDFSDVDVTDLETFGDTAAQPLKRQKTAVVQKVALPGRGHTCDKTTASFQEEEEETEEGNMTPTDTEDAVREDLRPQGPAAYSADSEDEVLVIDDPTVPADLETSATASSTDLSPVPKRKRGRPKKADGPKMVATQGDQLGEILRMQSAMLKPKAKASPVCLGAKCPPAAATPVPESSPSPSSGHAHPTSLVKPCVTSYLENQNQDGEGGGPPVVQHSSTTEHKSE